MVERSMMRRNHCLIDFGWLCTPALESCVWTLAQLCEKVLDKRYSLPLGCMASFCVNTPGKLCFGRYVGMICGWKNSLLVNCSPGLIKNKSLKCSLICRFVNLYRFSFHCWTRCERQPRQLTKRRSTQAAGTFLSTTPETRQRSNGLRPGCCLWRESHASSILDDLSSCPLVCFFFPCAFILNWPEKNNKVWILTFHHCFVVFFLTSNQGGKGQVYRLLQLDRLSWKTQIRLFWVGGGGGGNF